MKNLKKMLIGVCSVAAFGCVTFGAMQMSFDDASAETTAEQQQQYLVLGGAVRVNDSRGAGVKFHVAMTTDYFDIYGTINSDGSGTLDSNVTTGTLLLPTHLTNGNLLEVNGTGYKASVSDSNTSAIWTKQEYGGVDYMQSIVYLYNIPSTDYGTEISVRGYIHTGSDYIYTAQVDTISMSAVAELEYNDPDSKLSETEKDSLKSTYLNKTVTYHVNGTPYTESLDFKQTPVIPTEVAQKIGGSDFIGWATKDGTIQKNVTSTLVKNNRDLYAVFQQKWLMTDSNFSLDLSNYSGYTVNSIKLGDNDLGTDAAALTIPDDLKNNTQSHGEKTVTVELTKNGSTLTLNLPVLLVTKEIKSVQDFWTIQPKNGENGKASEPVYGYYVLTKNISGPNGENALTGKAYYDDNKNTNTGFQGTFDGQGFEINAAANTINGIFGVLKNATIKNVTIKDSYRSASYATFLLAYAVYDSTFDNVTFTWSGGGNQNSENLGYKYGWIAGAGFSGNTLKDVTINDTGARGSLFGHHFKDNTFDNVTINSGTYNAMGTQQPTTSGGGVVSVTLDQVTKVETTKVTLNGRQDFILDGDWSLLDLGDYNGAEILSVKTSKGDLLDGISSRSAKAILTDKTKHGEQNIIVTVIHNGSRVEITVPVTIITKSINTMQELQDTVKVTTSNNNDIYGYYILGKDLSYSEEGFTPVNGTGGYSGAKAFRGTLDGRGCKITLKTANQNAFTFGIFGVMQAGSILKNVTIVDENQYQWGDRPMLAQSAYGATIENVNFEIKVESTNYAPIVQNALSNVTMKNVTITSTGTLAKVFDTEQGTNTFENVIIKANVTRFSTTNQDAPSGVTIGGDVVEVKETCDFILGGNTAQINLGKDYEKYTISSYEYDTYTWAANAAIPAALAAAYDKHGEGKSLKITATEGNKTVVLVVPVTVVTKSLSTMSELETAVRIHSNTETKNGYYILANDITEKITQNGYNAYNNDMQGFIGTLNGRNHKIVLVTNDAAPQGGLFGYFKGTLKNVTLEAQNAYKDSKTILAYWSTGTLENVQISITALKTATEETSYKNQSDCGALVGNISYGCWKNVTVTCDTEMNALFGGNYQEMAFENCVLNVPGYNKFILGKDNVIANGWTVNLTGKNVELTDTTTQLIDLGITDGDVNNTKTYTLQVAGLTDKNFISASYNGTALQMESGLTFKVLQFGKTYGEGNLEIKYYYNDETKTHTVPILLATKVLTTATDVKDFLSYADKYIGTEGDGIYDGYFALGNDIDYNSYTYDPPMIFDTDTNGKKIPNEEIGFRGVFDGQGHTIDKMTVACGHWVSGTNSEFSNSNAYRNTGFISVLHKDGVLKNTAFTNAKVQYCSYLSSWGGGLIENVFVGYEGNTNDAWNSTVNTTRDSAPAVRMHNCVISYDTDWNASAYILGKVNVSANAYQNVYVVGPNKTNIVSYFDDGNAGDFASKTPKGDDNFAYYENAAALLADHKNEISAWDFFSVNNSGISFGNNSVLSGTAASKTFTGSNLISADKTSSDYIIVYEDGNADALNAATFIAEHIQRATGTVTYTANGGMFKESVTGGVRLPITTKLPVDTWSDSLAIIFVGNTGISNVPTASAGTYIVKTSGKSVFIHASDDVEYITAAMAFLEEAIGYKALSDDTVYYEKVGASNVEIGTLNIEYDSAFNVRNSTNAYHTWKNDQLALNGRSVFTIGPKDDNGVSQAFHNTIYWLDYKTNVNTHQNWFRKVNSSGEWMSANTEVCFFAGGSAQDSTNTSYTAMVEYAATQMRNALIANPGVNKLTFSIMDNDNNGCQCNTCKNSNRTNAEITFLNAVAEKIVTLDAQEGIANRDFTIFVLAYKYVLAAPTVNMNEHLGVIYAPIGHSYEAKSIYDTSNENVRTQISGWAAKTNNVGFWFYGTLYHNYMLFNDTFESMLTWFEYAARTVKTTQVNGKYGEPVWVYVNGQTRTQRNATAFESFKQYAFSKAQVEILNKVTVDGKNADYTAQIQAYLKELEGEFFGFTVENNIENFKDGGYYGAADANKAMYELYGLMKEDYKTASNKAGTDEKAYTTSAYIGQLKYNKTIGTGTYNRVQDYVQSGSEAVYWDYYTKAQITAYMAKIEAAQAANVKATSLGNMKAVYERHVLVESLSPRFMICIAGGSSNSTYGFSDGYGGKTITEMKSALTQDFADLGIVYYGEHNTVESLNAKFGIGSK